MLSGRTALRLFSQSLLYLLVCSAAHAQESTAPPAYIAIVDGTATLERNGEAQPAVRNMPFVAGDRLRTEAGRVEIDFPDGSAIEVGEYSEVEALSPTRVRLISGTMDHVALRTAQSDSAPYLPSDLRPYGQMFDQYGSWNYDTSYGYVWYPQVVGGWRPYYYGSWATVPSYGWTWIGLDPWSWPTHHYGRWGYARNAWFWIPGRAWSAAWVSWGVTPDYVGWCPLGFDGRPVFALSIGYGAPGWSGWTVMSRSHFGYRGHYAHNYSVDPRYFDSRTTFIQTRQPPPLVGHDRDRWRGGDTRAASVDRPEPQGPRHNVVPPAAAVGVAVPRGTTRDSRLTGGSQRVPSTPDSQIPNPGYRRAPDAERRFFTAVPRLSNVEPRAPNPESRFSSTPDSRIPNPEFRRGVPTAAPRMREPVVPAAAAIPRTAPAKTAPEYRLPTPEYRRPPVEYRPAIPHAPPSPAGEPHERAPQRLAPAPVERSAPPAYAVPRGSAPAAPAASAPSAKTESGGARRPR
jgi:hypothetical protein